MKPELTDVQWCVLSLLVEAKAQGVGRIHRFELLHNDALPARVRAKLVFGALVMPEEYVRWVDEHQFEATDAGVAIFRERFPGAAKPPEGIIYLPGPVYPSAPGSAAPKEN